MIYLRVLIVAFNILLLCYYAMIVGQALNLICFTKQEIKFHKGIIPFYYWIHSEPKKNTSNKSNIVKPIKTKNNV